MVCSQQWDVRHQKWKNSNFSSQNIFERKKEIDEPNKEGGDDIRKVIKLPWTRIPKKVFRQYRYKSFVDLFLTLSKFGNLSLICLKCPHVLWKWPKSQFSRSTTFLMYRWGKLIQYGLFPWNKMSWICWIKLYVLHQSKSYPQK